MSGSTVIAVRLPNDVAEHVESLAQELGTSISGALRILIELGFDAELDRDHMRMVQYNANALALKRLQGMLEVMLENFRSDM